AAGGGSGRPPGGGPRWRRVRAWAPPPGWWASRSGGFPPGWAAALLGRVGGPGERRVKDGRTRGRRAYEETGAGQVTCGHTGRPGQVGPAPALPRPAVKPTRVGPRSRSRAGRRAAASVDRGHRPAPACSPVPVSGSRAVDDPESSGRCGRPAVVALSPTRRGRAGGAAPRGGAAPPALSRPGRGGAAAGRRMARYRPTPAAGAAGAVLGSPPPPSPARCPSAVTATSGSGVPLSPGPPVSRAGAGRAVRAGEGNGPEPGEAALHREMAPHRQVELHRGRVWGGIRVGACTGRRSGRRAGPPRGRVRLEDLDALALD